MRRLLLAPALGASALGIVAASAQAHPPTQVATKHEFTGSEQIEVRAAASGAQKFTFGPFAITCERAKTVAGHGTASWPSETLFVQVKYSGCSAVASLRDMSELHLKAKFVTPLSLNYHANGFVEAGAEGTPTSGKLEGAKAAEIALSGPFRCTIDVAPGTFPSRALRKPEEQFEAATYKVEETKIEKGKHKGVQDKLAITTALSKMAYELEGEFCEALSKTEGVSGAYDGTLLAELPKASLGFE